MRRSMPWLGAVMLLVPLVAGAEPAVTEAKLRYDPFQPLSLAPDEVGGAYGAAAKPGWRPVLHATLVGEHGAFANLGGEILRVGESTRGYQLVEVGPWDAVFEHGGSRVRLSVTPPASAR